ncbi:MAG TPA: flagellar assembly protein FliW [Spirochaetales bacterium]|nr:flagellar assembly protein FliW [Spirochaetales bacterium]
MQIRTKAYGPLEIDERQILQFPYGLIGFEQFKTFALLDAAQQPFYWLQSLDIPEIAFILINPLLFRPDYTPDVEKEDLEELELESPEDLLVFTIVTIPENQVRMTANLQGPILINRKRKIGRQSISLNPNWQVKHVIMDELAGLRD